MTGDSRSGSTKASAPRGIRRQCDAREGDLGLGGHAKAGGVPRGQAAGKMLHVLGVDLAIVDGILDEERHLHHAVERGAGRAQDRRHVLERPPRLLRRSALASGAADVVARSRARHEHEAGRARGAGERARSRRVPSTAAGKARCYTRAVFDPTAPLGDLVVLDFTRVLAGPYCTRLLADLGARVIKIERAGGGDDMRKGHLQLDAARDDQSTYFTRINVGKQSVGLDLGHPATRDVVRDLAGKADVAVENFAPGVAQRLGIDYDSLAAVKPDLVYCSI